MSDKGIHESENARFPDFGPCEIPDWKGFLIKAEEQFYSKWGKPFTHKETLSDFDQVSYLGGGSFGDVVLIKHKKDKTYYAMKVIEKEKVIKYKQLEHLKSEKMTLQCIDFPLAVYLHFCFKDNSFIYLVMPFIPGGDFFGHLKKVGNFGEVQTKFYVCQVILALEYLHHLDIVYRDLKPENILIDHTGYLKITDFGFCKRLMNSRTYTLCGTPEYLAPEVILNKGYGKAVDWWAIGVFMFELAAGNPPFTAREQMKIYEKIVSLKYKMPSFFSADLKDLVKNILQVDLTRRYGNLKNGVDDIKDHKWFRTMNWMAILNRKMATPYKPRYTQPGDTSHFEDCKKITPLKIANKELYPKEFASF